MSDEKSVPKPVKIAQPWAPDSEGDENSSVTRLKRVDFMTKVQWAFIIGVGAFTTWGLVQLGVVKEAQAQSTANHDQIVTLQAQITTVDAGARSAVERLEKKIDENKADTDRKLDEIRAQQRLDRAAILDAIKKK